MNAGQVDPDAGEPLWRQVQRILIEQIKAGNPPQGKLLPSIKTLAQTYEVSEGTIKKALREMKRAGLIDSENGRGSYPV
jgi:DNA-binding GntR family transcriptional regulator